MITFFKKPENLLPVIPLLFLLIEETGFRGTTIDIHLHDTMYVILRSHFFGVLLVLMIFYWLMHLFLRQRNRGNNAICAIHIYGTIISLVAIYTYIMVLYMHGSEDSVTSAVWKSRLRDEPFALVMATFILILISLQVLFFLYFMIRVVGKR
jgi:hypothetical protein